MCSFLIKVNNYCWRNVCVYLSVCVCSGPGRRLSGGCMQSDRILRWFVCSSSWKVGSVSLESDFSFWLELNTHLGLQWGECVSMCKCVPAYQNLWWICFFFYIHLLVPAFQIWGLVAFLFYIIVNKIYWALRTGSSSCSSNRHLSVADFKVNREELCLKTLK